MINEEDDDDFGEVTDENVFLLCFPIYVVNEEEASRQNLNAEKALCAEQLARQELEKAEQEMAAASTEEEKEKAKKAGKKAKKTVLKHKKTRLSCTLQAALNWQSKQKIDAGIVDAKEALPEIPSTYRSFCFWARIVSIYSGL